MNSRHQPARATPVPGPLGWLSWRPLFLVCCGLVVGIAAADRLPHTIWASALVGLGGLVIGAVGCVFRGKTSTAAILLASMCAGAASHNARMVRRADDISFLAPAKPVAITMRVMEVTPAMVGENAVCRAETIELSPGRTKPVSGLIRLHSRETPLSVGDEVSADGGSLRPWRMPTNPFQMSRAPDWQRRGVWCYSRPDSVQVLSSPSRPALSDLAASWRAVLTHRLELAMLGDNSHLYAHLVAAITFGGSLDDLPQSVIDAYRRTGTIHVLVVSGAQVTVIVLLLLALTGRVGRGVRAARPSQLVFVLLATFAYALLCGRQPSILRAGAMAAVMLLGVFGGRHYDTATAVALVAAMLLLAQPADLFGPSLQLTFAALIGMIAATRLLGNLGDWPAPRVNDKDEVAQPAGGLAWFGRAWPVAARAVVYALVGTFGAWAMTAPILAAHFGGLSLTGNIANAIVIPIADLTLIIGLVGTALAFIHPLTAMLPMYACRELLVGAGMVNGFCSRLPMAYTDHVSMTTPIIIAWYVAAVAAYVLMKYGGRWQRAVAGTAGLGALITLLAVAATPTPALAPTVTWLDVGEGLCTVVETPGHHFMLYDAGSSDPDIGGPIATRQVILPYLRGRGCKRLDAIIISHPDSDHYNAVASLLPEMPVGRMIVGPYGESPGMQRLEVQVRMAKIPIQVARAGARMSLGDVRVRFLHPQPWPVIGPGSYTNNNCLVVALDANGSTVMLTGDLERAGQEELMKSWPTALDCTVLQAPHHGRLSAFDREFLETALPKIIVVPCGPRYDGGDVAPELAQECLRLGTAFLPTARWGAVTVEMWPGGVLWRTFLHQPLRERYTIDRRRRRPAYN